MITYKKSIKNIINIIIFLYFYIIILKYYNITMNILVSNPDRKE